MWFFPLAGTPSYESGLSFETNDFNGKSRPCQLLKHGLTISPGPKLFWPPPDPEKMDRPHRLDSERDGFVHGDDKRKDSEWLAAVNRRQQRDLSERRGAPGTVRQRVRHEASEASEDEDEDSDAIVLEDSSEEDSEDDDSDSERSDNHEADEDVPLSELIARRRRAQENGASEG